MPPEGFEPTISAGERPQTLASDRAATGTDFRIFHHNDYNAHLMVMFCKKVSRRILNTKLI